MTNTLESAPCLSFNGKSLGRVCKIYPNLSCSLLKRLFFRGNSIGVVFPIISSYKIKEYTLNGSYEINGFLRSKVFEILKIYKKKIVSSWRDRTRTHPTLKYRKYCPLLCPSQLTSDTLNV